MGDLDERFNGILAVCDARLGGWQRSVRQIAAMARLILVTRILLAIAFIPTGLVKVLGHRFTNISPETDIGMFFEGLYRTGPLWRLIGGVQILGGVLLLIPRTATLGTVLFFPVILSIFLATIGLGFRGTWIITGLMLFAVCGMLLWDYHRLRAATLALLGMTAETQPIPIAPLDAPPGLLYVERAALIGGCVAGLAVFLAARSFLPMSTVRYGVFGGLLCAAVLCGAWAAMAAIHFRRRRSSLMSAQG